ncbi:MAG: PQQ-binding-like beta-propeller repeat protein, partial [Myxococcota bacterium]|nr:PQQ-binding-like beta-propeller repeat protein [Myxococcota bacterium]
MPEWEGAYVPVERASAALDPERDRLYVGSTAGVLYAMRGDGLRLWRYDARGAIESAPALDAAAQVLFVGTEQGELHALDARDGRPLWREPTGGPVRSTPALSRDAVYVVTDTDLVLALSRTDGSTLWSYGRQPQQGFAIAGHAGIAMHEGRLYTGFTDGAVVALDAASGDVVWIRETAEDLLAEEASEARRFFDVDTTPVVREETVLVASFSGGLYELDRATGSVLRREARWTGVSSIALERHRLVLASADEGLVCLEAHGWQPLWRRAVRRGAPGVPLAVGPWLLVGESEGS